MLTELVSASREKLVARPRSTNTYDRAFYRYQNRNSQGAARAIGRLLRRWLDVRSVVDFGCAQGVWLAAWKEAGASDVVGLDGDYVDRRTLLIEPTEFHAADLRKPIDLGRTFDLAQSLEVAEHIPEAFADVLVDSLVRHSDVVLFSAAVPGQLGENHVNERPYEYWRAKFAARGYVLLDAVRPRVRGGLEIKFYYRYNCLLFVRRDHLGALPEELRASLLPDDAPVPSFAPWWFRCVLAITSRFPRWLGHGLSLLEKTVSNGVRGLNA